MSVSVFAAKDVVPSDEVLKDYYDEGNVCVCFFVPADMACNNMVVTGSFNGWKSTSSECVPAEPVEGYDGWYVASFEPEAEPDASKGIQAKPVMIDVDGNFNWEYQVGAATAIRGGVQVVQGAYAGEIDLINYGTDAPNVFTVDAWKSNPCTAIYHNYKFTVISEGCDGYVCPFIVGAFTGWGFTQMQYDVDASQELGADVYTFSVKTAEESPYQIVSGLWNDQGEIGTQPGWNDDSYLQKLIDENWVRMPGEQGDNLLTHESPNITFDIREADLRWARCDGAQPENVIVALAAPENAPAAIEIIGSFDAWTGQAMELQEGIWGAIVSAKASAQFKFREAGSWDNQIEYYDEENDEWHTFGDGNKELIFGELWEDGEEQFAGYKVITLDFRNPDAYRWQAGGEPEEPEHVVLWMNLPTAIAPEAVEIIGTFDEWAGTAMEHLENGWWFAELDAKASQFFKIRGAGSWDKEIEIFDGAKWEKIADGQFKFGDLWQDDTYKGDPCKSFELDWSNPEKYRWTAAQGIENITLTEKAQKVVVDGVLYIVRDNKLFNVQGTQVR